MQLQLFRPPPPQSHSLPPTASQEELYGCPVEVADREKVESVRTPLPARRPRRTTALATWSLVAASSAGPFTWRGHPPSPSTLPWPAGSRLHAFPTPLSTDLGFGNAALKANPRRQQGWFLMCLHGGQAYPLVACGVAMLCCVPHALRTETPRPATQSTTSALPPPIPPTTLSPITL
jgi:hypothetical protein